MPDLSALPPIRLLMHGAERHAFGGPGLRVPRTAQALRDLGVQAQAAWLTDVQDIAEDIVHLFNVWSPDTALRGLQALKRAGKRVVFSPIYLDLSASAFWNDIPAEGDIAAHARRARAALAGRARGLEILPGYHAQVREMLSLADHVIFLSAVERAALAAIGAEVPDTRASLIHNPVDAALWQGGDPDLFRAAFLPEDPRDYVLCVGRIEPRKNQLLLAQALRGLPWQLVLIGRAGDAEYAARIQSEAGAQVRMLGRLPAGSDLLRSALAGARVFCLPSWSEGASLAALEAAAAGVPLALSDTSSEREYFGDHAQYCAPWDPDDIRRAVLKASQRPAEDTRALQDLVAQRYSWARYAELTAKAYDQLQKTVPAPVPRAAAPPVSAGLSAPPPLALDITGLIAERGRAVRRDVLADLAQALHESHDVRLVYWHTDLQRYIDAPRNGWGGGQLARHAVLARQARSDAASIDGHALIVPGQSWAHDRAQFHALADLHSAADVIILSYIDQPGILSAPHWYPAEQEAALLQTLPEMAQLASALITATATGAEDLSRALAYMAGDPAPVHVIPDRLRGEDKAGPDRAAPEILPNLGARPYVLVESDLSARDNLDLVARVWARLRREYPEHAIDLVILHPALLQDPDAERRLDRLARDPALRECCFLLANPARSQRNRLLKDCLFSLAPAHHADSDIRVADSLALNAVCLCSDIQGYRPWQEKGAICLDPDEVSVWLDKIVELVAAPEMLAAARARLQAPDTWQPKDAAQAFSDLAAQVMRKRGPTPLRAGEIVTPGTMTMACDPRWHPVEPWGRWARADRAGFRVNLSKLRADLPPGQSVLTVMLQLAVPVIGDVAGVPPLLRRLCIRVQGEIVYEARLRGAAMPPEIFLSLPVVLIPEDGIVTFNLSLPTQIDTSGSEAQARQLGVGLVALRVLHPHRDNLLACTAHPDGWTTLDCNPDMDLSRPEHRESVARGLVHDLAWGCGSRFGRVELWLPVLPDPAALCVQIACRPVAKPDQRLYAQVFWNGQPVGQGHWDSDQPILLEFELPAGAHAQSAPACLEIVTDSLATPADLALGHCDNIAGLGVTDVFLSRLHDTNLSEA